MSFVLYAFKLFYVFDSWEYTKWALADRKMATCIDWSKSILPLDTGLFNSGNKTERVFKEERENHDHRGYYLKVKTMECIIFFF